ncbi:FeoB-associated Cys-rich membrane protein [Butyrivibrio sp. AE2032]|nr:FeoB-associated Cys-rich membrane protein [Butyrivibrio sp. AE2032]
MANIIAGAVIILLLGTSIRYIYKEKKKGTHCIGCPMAGNCHKEGNCH